MVSQRDAYKMGYDEGYSIAGFNSNLLQKMSIDTFVEELLYVGDYGIKYSPWLPTANEFNESRNPDGVWDAYEHGLQNGVKKFAMEYTHKKRKVLVKKQAKRVKRKPK